MNKKNHYWMMPKELFYGAWLVFSLSYSYSGIDKLSTLSWQHGDTLGFLYKSALVKNGPILDIILLFPDAVLKWITWLFLGLEVFFAPLCIAQCTRVYAWGLMTLMHVIILLTVEY